jgi:hypothetical protein
LKFVGQCGAEEAVARGKGDIDFADAGEGHIAEAAADRITDQQRAGQDGGGDGGA